MLTTVQGSGWNGAKFWNRKATLETIVQRAGGPEKLRHAAVRGVKWQRKASNEWAVRGE